MAARRLLIIMVVLLTISTLAAALVPPPEEPSGTDQTTSSTTTTRVKESATGGRLVDDEVAFQPERKQPQEVRVAPGDQLSLVVSSGNPGEVSVPAFGMLEFAGPGSPARFDILVEKAGRYPVRFRGAGTVATIVAEVNREARRAAGER